MKTIPFVEASVSVLSLVNFPDRNRIGAPPKRSLSHLTTSALSTSTEVALPLNASATNIADCLRPLIRILLLEGYPHLSIAAEKSGMSIRTFQRRLEDHNLNYSPFAYSKQ